LSANASAAGPAAATRKPRVDDPGHRPRGSTGAAGVHAGAEPARSTGALTRIFLGTFLASLLLSLLVAAPAAGGLAQGWKDTRLVDELVKPFVALFAPAPVETHRGEATGADPLDVNRQLQEIEHRLHPSPSLLFALVQVATVVAISTMWFYAFTLRATRRHPNDRTLPMLAHSWPVLWSLVPVVIFVLAMYQAYQPAVLVMALVAILVAAEHYSGLRLQEGELEEHKRQLERQAALLQAARGDLSVQMGYLKEQADTLKNASSDLTALSKSTDRLLSDAGLSHFVEAVYTAYQEASSVRAVVRLPEIDVEWWRWARNALAPRHRASMPPSPWKAYFESAMHRDSDRGITLARALQLNEARPQLSGAFVTDLPMPGSQEWRRRELDPDEPLFQDLLGLAWQLVVLNQARAQASGKCTLSAWVSRPLCWVHATDSMVFQVLRREPRDQSAVLIIADTSRDEKLCSPAEREASRSLLVWAHDEIQRYVDRGSRAEEYVFAALRYAMIEASKYDTTQLVRLEQHADSVIPRATDDLHYLLSLLGSQFWLKSGARSRPGPDKIRDDADIITVAGDVFARLIHDRVGRIGKLDTITARQLSLEVL
jgi:hypothetical protein